MRIKESRFASMTPDAQTGLTFPINYRPWRQDATIVITGPLSAELRIHWPHPPKGGSRISIYYYQCRADAQHAARQMGLRVRPNDHFNEITKVREDTKQGAAAVGLPDRTWSPQSMSSPDQRQRRPRERPTEGGAFAH